MRYDGIELSSVLHGFDSGEIYPLEKPPKRRIGLTISLWNRYLPQKRYKEHILKHGFITTERRVKKYLWLQSSTKSR